VIAPVPQPSFPAPSHSQALVNPQLDDSMSNYDDSYDYGDYGADGDGSYDGALVDPNMSGADGNKGGILPAMQVPEGWQCTLCGVVIKQQGNYKRHFVDKHGTEKSHICRFCNKAYKTRNSMETHQYLYHKEQLNSLRMGDWESQ